MDNSDDSDPVIIALNSKIKEPQGYYKTGGETWKSTYTDFSLDKTHWKLFSKQSLINQYFTNNNHQL